MNKYKVDFYALSRHSVMVCADSKEEAIDFAKEIYMRTELIDLEEDELEAVFIEANLYDEQKEEESIGEYDWDEIEEDYEEECDKDVFKINKNTIDDDDELRLRVIRDLTNNEIHYEATCPICHKVVSVDTLMEQIFGE